MNPRILWLHSDKAGCGTYRCFIPALTLEAEGYDNNFMLTAGMRQGFLSATGDPVLEHLDVVVFQRAFGPLAISWVEECRRRGLATIVEIDDDLSAVPKGNPAHDTWKAKPAQRAIGEMLYAVDHVICSTEPLRWALQSTYAVPSRKITVAHNHLHRSVWPEALLDDRQHTKPEGQIIIGWQGSATHDADFAVVTDALKTVLATYPQVVLRFFGSVPLSLKGHVEEARFSWAHGVPFDLYPSSLHYANFDIGIAPLVANRFNEAKSNLKWLEYSALKIPCVASHVYPYAESVVEAQTGFLCRTTSEWVRALSTLVESAALRQTVGQQAYDTVWARWHPDRHIGDWQTAIAKSLDTLTVAR